MQVQSLAEIELRDAVQPLNRSAPSNFGPSLRTPALIRELVALGVVDASLSKVLLLSGKVLGGCLVERMAGGGLLSALSIEPLAQQRGGGRALLEGVIKAARIAQLAQLRIEVSEGDSAQESLIGALHFVRVETLHRLALLTPPNRSLFPTEEFDLVTEISVEDAISMLSAQTTWQPAPSAQPDVIRKLTKRLSALTLVRSDRRATLIFDKERKLIWTLGGDSTQMAQLVVYVAAKHGVVFVDSLRDEDPAISALVEAGFTKLAVRAAYQLTLEG
jgi:GNAT superfamily N-acetyltransferase